MTFNSQFQNVIPFSSHSVPKKVILLLILIVKNEIVFHVIPIIYNRTHILICMIIDFILIDHDQDN